MKVIEPLILFSWLIIIFIYQFHEISKEKIKKFDFLSLIPSFHLFSPTPFLGMYVIRYEILDSKDVKKIILSGEINYLKNIDLLNANKKIIKCVNNLCRKFPGKSGTSNNLHLLVHFIKSQLQSEESGTRFRFTVVTKLLKSEKVKFKSVIYDL